MYNMLLSNISLIIGSVMNDLDETELNCTYTIILHKNTLNIIKIINLTSLIWK